MLQNHSASYFQYNISHPNKYGVPQVDLSSDEMTIAIEEDSFTHSQLLIERVIFKTFTHHRCNVVITDHLRSLFTCELSRMGRTMHKLDGRGRES